MRADCSLVILAGGLSRRMGRDKAALPAGDGTLIEHLARRLGPVVEETIVAGGSVTPNLPDVRLVADRQALGGMATAYLCEHFVCQAPTQDPGELARQLDALRAKPVAS